MNINNGARRRQCEAEHRSVSRWSILLSGALRNISISRRVFTISRRAFTVRIMHNRFHTNSLLKIFHFSP